MIVVDVVAIAALLIALAVGIGRGFLASIGTIVGLVVGALAAYWLVPLAGAWITDAAWRPIALVVGSLLLVVLGASAGAALGELLRAGVDKTKLKAVDRLFGGVLSVAATSLVLLLVGASVTATGAPGIASAVASSRVLGAIDALTPPPVDAALAQLRVAVLDEGLPRLGELLRPQPGPVSPPVALDDPLLQTAGGSVARISGTAYACGIAVTGSGFVAAADLVVTNAHVIAGVDLPLVELPGQTAREGRVVYFDPIGDLAVIAVDSLAARPLPIIDPLSAGSAAVVQGYPLGGPFTSTNAQVLSVGTVSVPDIYDASFAAREIYSLEADVRPGNSGGPLLTGAGEVAGVVFARGDDDQARGYAMTTTPLRSALNGASAQSASVSTGRCIG